MPGARAPPLGLSCEGLVCLIHGSEPFVGGGHIQAVGGALVGVGQQCQPVVGPFDLIPARLLRNPQRPVMTGEVIKQLAIQGAGPGKPLRA